VNGRTARHLVPLFALALTSPVSAAAANKPNEVTTEVELNLTFVEPIETFSGEVKVVAADPRFVLTATVEWIRRSDVLSTGSEQAFAIHSKAQFLLTNWTPGDRRCYRLTRRRRAGRTSWSLFPALGAHACRRSPDDGILGGI